MSYVKTDLEAVSGTPPDCPRISVVKNKVENFNGGAETVTHIDYAENKIFVFGAESGTATSVDVWMEGAPHDVHSKTWFYPAGNWQEGLPLGTEDTAGGTRQRWTRTLWTQDNTGVIYKLNPRLTQSKVGDTANVKRTDITYLTTGSLAGYGLVSKVELFDGNTNVLYKSLQTDYNAAAAYVSRRIIGLPSEVRSYGLENNVFKLASKVGYAYDENEGGFGDSALQQNLTSVIKHDTANYGAGFVAGRGNLTSATRYNIENSSTIISSFKHNTAGAVVAQTTPGSGLYPTRTVKIAYTDSFNDDTGRNTYAYPTTLTDPAGYSSMVKYRYDIGANVWAQSPDLDAVTAGKVTARVFDALGRLERQALIGSGGAYTRYEYPTNQIQSRVYSTVTDVNNNGADAADEVLTETWTDGAGRVRQSRTPFSFDGGGATQTWSGTITEYDVLGRVKRSTVPTEVDSNWALAGDDAVRNTWLWNSQEYDWKGRVTKEINSDGTFKTIDYEGCGCAGGQKTTVKGEEIVEKDWQGNTTANLGKRTQKIYADLLGRTWKTEVLNWDGAAVYLTTVNTFNGRDQILTSTRTEAASNLSQITTLEYDGHGRVKTQKRPEQTSATSYNYNADDSIQTVVDARGASTIYTYNDVRGLLTSIGYQAPSQVPAGTTIPAAAPVSFEYDNLGNRKKMTDGAGTVDYVYNSLSQMTSETRKFIDNSTTPPLSLANAPLAGNGFKLTYEYTLSGQLKSLEDPYNQKINYAYDKIGRLNAVAGQTAFGGISTYANNPQYRAWGGLKHLEYGNGVKFNITGYNDKLQATGFELKDASQQTIMSKTYDYYADGSLRKLDDAVDDRFDRLNTYDFAGRVKSGKTGAEARGGTVAPADMETQLPYRQSYDFNAFNNMTQRNNLHWGVDYWAGQSNNLSYSYQNNKITNTGWTYDADGRVLESNSPDDYVKSTYDAGGQLTRLEKPSETDIYRTLDGGGREAKRKKLTWTVDYNGYGSWVEEIKYFVRSSVLGGEVVSEVNSTGRKLKTIVRAAGATLAWQTMYHNESNNTHSEYVNFEHRDASGLSYRSTTAAGDAIYGEGAEGSPAELDPLGGNVGLYSPYFTFVNPPAPEDPSLFLLGEESPQYVNGQRVTCQLDGLAIGCNQAYAALENGSAIPAALAAYQNLPGFSFQNNGLGIFTSFVPGHWESINANHGGGGNDDVIRIYTDTTFVPATTNSFYFNISWSPTRQTQQPIETLPTNLRGAVETRLDDGNCRQFLNNLLAQLGAKDKNVDDLFGDVEKIGGPEVVRNLVDFRTPVDGISYYGKKRTIGINAYNKRDTPTQSNQIVQRYITTIFHELIHRGFGKESHEPLARAAFSLLSVENKDVEKLPTKQDAKSQGISLDTAFSRYLDRRINDKCKYDPNIKPGE